MRPVTVRFEVSHGSGTGSALLLITILFLSACSSAKKPLAEALPSAPATPVDHPQQLASTLPPPELKTVEEAVKRVFKDAALVDTSHRPVFIAGDFNGDLSQDIAVVVKPAAERISEMNEEFPAWLLRDPLGSAESKGPRLRIAVDDVLLAVIHGYGANGWHDPQATQTYLLKNSAGSVMETRPLKEFVSANQGKTLPRLRGDLISQSIQGRTRYLYFAGATYSSFDPKTFTGEQEARRGHGDQRMKQ